MPERPTILGSLQEKLDPTATALLVIDMSNDFLDPEGATAQRANRPLEHARSVIPAIKSLAEGARDVGALVVYVQHMTLRNHASDSGPWLDARSRATYSVEDICLEGTWGQKTIDELKPEESDVVVPKYRYSGFAGTNLDLVLRSHGIRTVVCTGVSTNVCVEATAREAFSHEYYVVLPTDACASWDRALHDASLSTAGHRYATLTDTGTMLEIWRR